MKPGRASWGPVRIAWVSVPVEAPDPQAPREAQRAQAHELLATLVAELDPGAAITIVRQCATCGADGHGRPVVVGADVVVSIAYAGPVVVVAVAPQPEVAAIGVDLERVPAGGRQAPLAELGPLFAPAAAPSIEGWALLEAALKADGRGLRVELGNCVIGREPAAASPGGGAVAEYEISVPGRPAPIQATTLPALEEFVLSVALIPSSGAPPQR